MNSNLSRNKLEEIKNSIEAERALKAKGNDIKSLQCVGCGYWIDDAIDEYFYFCEIHKNVFCERCATNKGKLEVEYKDAKHCPNIFLSTRKNSYIGEHVNTNCIYQKKFLQFKEVENGQIGHGWALVGVFGLLFANMALH